MRRILVVVLVALEQFQKSLMLSIWTHLPTHDLRTSERVMGEAMELRTQTRS
jgi:hypothetical protein